MTEPRGVGPHLHWCIQTSVYVCVCFLINMLLQLIYRGIGINVPHFYGGMNVSELFEIGVMSCNVLWKP